MEMTNPAFRDSYVERYTDARVEIESLNRQISLMRENQASLITQIEEKNRVIEGMKELNRST